jgi:hypothetical protein
MLRTSWLYLRSALNLKRLTISYIWVIPLRRKLGKTSHDFFVCCYRLLFPPWSVSGVLEKLCKCEESPSEIIHILKSWAMWRNIQVKESCNTVPVSDGYTSSHCKVYGLPMLHSVRYASCTDKVRADSHIPCRFHAALKANSQIPCRSPAATLPRPCHYPAILRQYRTRTVRLHAVSGRSMLIHTYNAVPMPFC